MLRRTLVIMLALCALAAPTMALTLTVDTNIPAYILDNELVLSGSTTPSTANWTDSSTTDLLQGTATAVSVSNGSVTLKPTLNFTTLNAGNPVFTPGSGTDWDRYLLNKHLVRYQGTYYMYYAAASSSSGAGQIGLATSDNGIEWVRYSKNPVLASGVDSYDKSGLDWPVVMKDGSTWRMWYSGAASSTDVSICYATSTDGYNWTKHSSNPVLANGASDSDWNGYEVRPCDVALRAGNYTMYFRGLGSGGVHYLGLAISTDCTSWTESGSNPLYRGETAGWNKGVYDFTTLEEFSGTFRLLGHGGTPGRSLGYITSTDGTTWTDSGAAILQRSPGSIYEDDMMYTDYIDTGANYYMNMLCVNGTNRTYGAFRVDRMSMMGSFVSREFNCGGICALNDVRFSADVPAGSSISYFVRWFNDTALPGDWYSYASSFNHSGARGQFFQYMASFASYKDWLRPRFNDATFDYTVLVKEVAVSVGFGNWVPVNGTPAMWTINLNLTDGDFDLYICATDAVGKQAQRIIPIRVDLYRPTGNITLEGGASATNSTTLRYATAATDTHGISSMMVSTDPGFASAVWVPFAATGSIPWTDVDGTATVYVKYRDGAGRESLPFSDTITVDTTAPSGIVSIAGGATYTNNRDIELSLSWTDLTGVASMRISNRADFGGAKWRDPEALVNWTLLDTEGTCTVYVQLMDELGWVTTIADDIVMDRALPAVGLSIDGGSLYTTDREVRLVVDIEDASPVMARLWNSDDPGQSDLEPFANHTEMDWSLSTGQDGSRSVELYAIDAAGNVARAKASVLLDTTPPSVVVRMAGGAPYTRSTALATTVTGTDATSGIHQMRRSASGDLSGVPWGPFEGAFEWTVAAPDGEKHLYVEVSDRAGLTTLVDASIILDTAAPAGTLGIDGGAQFAKSQVVTLHLDLTDAYQLGEMRTGNSPDLSSEDWHPFAPEVSWDIGNQDGERTVWAEVRDMAGNVWSGSDSIVLDLTDPVVSVTIEGGAENTLSPVVALRWSASDTNGLVEAAFAQDVSFTGAEVVALAGAATIEPTARTFTFAGTDGLKTLYVRLTDSSGRTTVATDGIWYASERPTGNLTLGTGSGWTRISHIEVRVTEVNGAPTKVRLATTETDLGSAVWQAIKTTSYPFDLVAGDGPKQVWMQLLAAHNVTSVPFNGTITLDTGKPAVTAAKAPPSKTSSSSIRLELTISDALDPSPTGLWRLNGGQWAALPAGPLELKLKEGTNTIDIEVKDAAGNPGTQSWTVKREGGGMPGGWGLLVVPAIAIVGVAAAVARRRRAP